MEFSNDLKDEELVNLSKEGNRKALEEIVQRYHPWIFNMVIRMVYDYDEAEDLTQDIIIKVVTKLSTYQGHSQFKTWLYRIVKNHVYKSSKGKIEKMVTTFTNYGKELDMIADTDLQEFQSSVELHYLVKEAKISCIHGMLLCLNREQRLLFILGEVIGVDHNVGSEIMEMNKDNFRQKLSRARRELYNFMHEKCGLINSSNSCRCHKKTKGFINLGIVDPQNLLFSKKYISSIKEVAELKLDQLEDITDIQYRDIYRDTPFITSPDFVASLLEIMDV